MLAIRHNLITCAAKRCPLPGTILVPHREPSVKIAGTEHTVERPVVHLEYCVRHAEILEAAAAEQAAAVDAASGTSVAQPAHGGRP